MTVHDDEFMKVYGVSDVARQLAIPPGTVRQWEKSLDGILEIPRDNKGERYYTEFEITTLRNVKAMREKKISFASIKEILNNPEGAQSSIVPSQTIMSQSQAIEAIQNLEQAIHSLNERMESIIEVSVQKEVAKLSEVIEKQQQFIEESIKQRDQQLMETLSEIREGKKQAAATSWWRRFKKQE